MWISYHCKPYHRHYFTVVVLLLCGLFNAALVFAQTPVIYAKPETSPAFVETRPVTHATGNTHKRVLLLPINPSTTPVSELGPLSVAEKQDLQASNTEKPLTIGIGRSLENTDFIDAQDLIWSALDNGEQLAQFIVRSQQAEALRIQLLFDNPPPDDAQFRFFAESSGEMMVSVSGLDIQQLDDNSYWSPTVLGDGIIVEILLAADTDPAELQFQVPLLSHLLVAPEQAFEKNVTHIGASGSCNIDVACAASGESSEQASIQSVAKYIYTSTFGFTSICSGNLIVDTDTSIFFPYFLTANHCVNNAADASNIEFYWLFQKETCAGPNPVAVNRQTGGATLLSTGADNDYTLLQLNANPPAGVGLSGWTTASINANTSVIGIHHPSGDLKKISFGIARGYAPYLEAVNGNGSHIFTEWLEGTTEGGSSGAGLWVEFNNQLLLVGTLSGGFASCEAQQAADYYNRFELYFPALAAWLNPGDNALTTVWWDPDRNGQGIQILRNETSVQGAWYLYDENGDGMWVTFGGSLGNGNKVNAELLRYSGPPLGTSWNNALVQSTPVGTVTIDFDSLTSADFTYTLNGVSDTLNIQPFRNNANGRYTKVWWDPSRSGQAVQVLHDGNTISGAWYLYDQTGQGFWVVFEGNLNGNTITADLLRFTGPELDESWDNGQVSSQIVGSITLQFQSDSLALMNYTLDGVSGNLNLEPFE